MANRHTGEMLTVRDPPNLLAAVVGEDGAVVGILRCSRLFFNSGVGPEAEISFQGMGADFQQRVELISKFVNGLIQLYSAQETMAIYEAQKSEKGWR